MPKKVRSEDMSIFGQRLEVLLDEAEMTKKELAEKLGVTASTLTNWQKKNDSPSYRPINSEYLLRLRNLFIPKPSLDWLLGTEANSGEKRTFIGQDNLKFGYDKLKYFPEFFDDYRMQFQSLFANANDIRYLGAIGESYIRQDETVLTSLARAGAKLTFLLAERSEINFQVLNYRSAMHPEVSNQDNIERMRAWAHDIDKTLNRIQNFGVDNDLVRIKYTKYIPPFPMLLIDPEDKNGTIVFGIYNFGKSSLKQDGLLRFGTVLRRKTYPELYEYLFHIFKNIWTSDVNAQQNGVEWEANIPRFYTAKQRDDAQKAIKIFSLLLNNGEKPREEIYEILRQEFKNFNMSTWESFRFPMKNVMKSRLLNIVHIGRCNHGNPSLEEKIAKKFNLRQNRVIIADIPPNMPFSVLRAEFVAELVNREVISHMSGNFAIGSGYTMHRVVERNSGSHDQFAGKRFISLMEFDKDLESVLSSDNMVRTLASKHKDSTPVPFADYNYDLDDRYKLDSLSSVEDMFVTVNHIVRPRSGNLPFFNSVRTADYSIDTGSDVISQLDKAKRREVAGEILGYWINDDGKVVEKHPHIHQVPLELLIQYSKADFKGVWLVAGRGYKSRAVLAALKAGFVNALVIDKEIALDLLDPVNRIYDLENEFWDRENQK